MSKSRQSSFTSRSSCRRAGQVRKLFLESLEARACPAVSFGFAEGVLSLTGDEGSNVIEISRRSDGLAEVVGDGERRTFEGVNKIVAQTGDGDDRVSGKIILWVRDVDPQPSTVPFSLDLDLGAGNDTAQIEDDNLITFRDLNDPRIRNLITTHSMDVHVDLGTGADDVAVQVEHHDIVHVDVNSADSFDSVQVGVKHPLPMPIRITQTRSEASIAINLAGGGHSVDVHTQNVDVVDLNVVVYAGRAPSDTSGNTIYVSSSGGGVWRAAVELGGADNVVDVRTENIDDVNLDLLALSGGNTVQFVGGDGRDRLIGIDFRPSYTLNLNFGGGDNLVDIRTANIDEMGLDLLATGGNNVVKHELGHTLGLRHEHIRPEAHINYDLRGDGNQLGLNAQGYEQVDLDLGLTGNDNRVVIGLLLPAVQKVREAAARVSFDIDGSNNQGSASNQGFGVWEVNLATPLPTGDSTADGTRQATSFVVTFDRPIDPAAGPTPTGTVKFYIDGNQTSPGSDSIEVHGQGFGAATVEADTAGGNDSIWIDIDAPILAVHASLGDGNDDANVPLRWFNAGPAPSQHVLSIDAGRGDDTVHAAVLPSVTDLVIDPFDTARIAIDGGEGDDHVFVQTRGVDDLQMDFTTGTGDDEVQASAVTGRITGIATDPSDNSPICNLRVDLGDGNDIADITTQGFSRDLLNLSAGAGNDTVSADSFYGTGVYKSTDSGKTWTLDLGEGNDLLNLVSQEFNTVSTDIKGGEGNDAVEMNTQWSTTPGRYLTLRPRPQSDETVDLGSGNDTLTYQMDGYAVMNASIHAGDGDDAIFSSDTSPSPSASPRPVLLVIANRDFYLGAGDDRLVIQSSGAGQTDIFIDAGDGDDSVQVRHRMFSIVDRTQLQTVIHLGAGSDSLNLETTGYRRISTAIDTGPAGDGNDTMIASHQSHRRSTRRHNSRLTLDSGLDTYQHSTKGYRVQGPVRTPTSVEWVFVAY